MGEEKGEDPSGRGMARRGLRWESVASRSGSEWRVRVCWRSLSADGCRVYVVRGPEEESLVVVCRWDEAVSCDSLARG